MPFKLIQYLTLFNSGGFSIFPDGWNNTRTAPQSGVFLAVDNLNVTAWGTSVTYGIRNNSGDAVLYGIQTDASGNVDIVENGSVVASDVTTLSLSTNYDLAIALDDNKIAHYFLYSSTQSEWRRIYVGTFATSAASVYANDTTVGATYTANAERFGTGMPYENETINIASPSTESGDLSDADFTLQVTAPSSGIFQFDFRKQDATNYWRLEYSVTGNTYRVYEVVNGSSTTRITYAGAAGSEALFMQAYGNTIKIWSAGALRGTYTAANNFLRETAWAIASAGTATANLKVWKSYTRNEAGLSAELVTNGTFDTDTDWTKGTGWSIAAGVASCDGTQVANSNLYQSVGTSLQDDYVQLSWDILNYSAGNIRAFATGGSLGATPFVASNGTHVYVRIGTSVVPTEVYAQADANFVGDIDNYSARRITWSTDTVGNKLNQAVA